MHNYSLKNKRVLITGVAGTIGAELLKQLFEMSDGPTSITGIDNNEGGIFHQQQLYSPDEVNLRLCDIRIYHDLLELMDNIDVVFHTAALKHVSICEAAPEQAISTNIVGTQNLIRACKNSNVEKALFTSSDKAVNPTNVMGTTKLMGERLMTAANASSENTLFSSTRFGNVLGSSGSVIEIFKKQIELQDFVTVTDKSMTRFVMSIEEAVKLVIDGVYNMRGGEVFVTKMPVINIDLLASVMIDELSTSFGKVASSIQKKYIGSKPGEKLYEELMSDEETRRSLELKNSFAILPAFRGYFKTTAFDYSDVVSDVVTNPYNSSIETPISYEAIKEILVKCDLLSLSSGTQVEQNWPGGDK